MGLFASSVRVLWHGKPCRWNNQNSKQLRPVSSSPDVEQGFRTTPEEPTGRYSSTDLLNVEGLFGLPTEESDEEQDENVCDICERRLPADYFKRYVRGRISSITASAMDINWALAAVNSLSPRCRCCSAMAVEPMRLSYVIRQLFEEAGAREHRIHHENDVAIGAACEQFFADPVATRTQLLQAGMFNDLRLYAEAFNTAVSTGREQIQHKKPARIDEMGNPRASAREEISAENNISVENLRWISNDTTKLYGSMIMTTTTRDEAEKIATAGYATILGETSFSRRYMARRRQCFKCHQPGHLARECEKTPVCGTCSSPSHSGKECECKANPKCALCGGNHRATQCPLCLLNDRV